MRSALAAASLPLRDAVEAVEEHLVWRLGDRLHGLAELVRWPFERLGWLVERRLVWPLQERAAGRGPAPRALGAGVLVTVVAGAVALGVAVGVSGSGSDGEPISSDTRIAIASPAAAPAEAERSAPVLQGVPPKFGVEAGVGVASATSGKDGDDAIATETTGTNRAGTGGEAGATTSSQKPVPAGPAAMKVARRFSEAFVFYEIGERPARALNVFQETATPQLATALAERPPRLPEGAKVPKARVLNLVPGPRRGEAYTVSASLLRVGVTSELRLELAMRKGAWLITDVRG